MYWIVSDTSLEKDDDSRTMDKGKRITILIHHIK